VAGPALASAIRNGAIDRRHGQLGAHDRAGEEGVIATRFAQCFEVHMPVDIARERVPSAGLEQRPESQFEFRCRSVSVSRLLHDSLQGLPPSKTGSAERSPVVQRLVGDRGSGLRVSNQARVLDCKHPMHRRNFGPCLEPSPGDELADRQMNCVSRWYACARSRPQLHSRCGDRVGECLDQGTSVAAADTVGALPAYAARPLA
jgi:hypothetical protein